MKTNHTKNLSKTFYFKCYTSRYGALWQSKVFLLPSWRTTAELQQQIGMLINLSNPQFILIISYEQNCSLSWKYTKTKKKKKKNPEHSPQKTVDAHSPDISRKRGNA